MIRIIFICSGNICRSAMAEGYLKKRLRDKNLLEKYVVTSAGTSAVTGQRATEFAKQAIGEFGVDLTYHGATHIKNSNILEADYIIVMTQGHKDFILDLYGHERIFVEKIFLLKEFSKLKYDYLDIDDPWGLDISVYKECAKEITESIDSLIERLEK